MREMSEKATKVWILALTSVASFMVALDALVVTTALSTIRSDLSVSIEALEWIVNAYNLSFAVLLLTGAALGDRFGRRRMFAAGLGLFVAAMLPMRFFRSRAFSSAIAASFLFYGSMYGVLFLLPQFLQVAQGYGSLGAGLRLLPWTATLLVFAPIAGVLVNRMGERSLVVVGLLLQAVGMAWIGLIAVPDLGYAKFIVPLILTGAGASIAMPAAQNAVVSGVAATEVGKASGTFNMSRFLGGAFGIATLVAVFSGTGGFGSAQVFSAGFAPAIGVSAALSLLAAIVGLRLPGRNAYGSAASTVTRRSCGNAAPRSNALLRT